MAPPLYARASKEGSGFEGASARVSSMLITCASGTPAELRPTSRLYLGYTSAIPRLVDCVAVPSVQHLDRSDLLLEHRLMHTTAR